jgi:hypothetical protein
MKTLTAKKRLIEIVDKLLNETTIIPDITMEFCNPFNKYADLDLEIGVSLDITFDGKDENETSYIFPDTVNVQRFNLLDESGNEVLSESQRKELVKFIDEYVYNYYSNLTKN